jgi:hypothetical protein
VDAAHAAAAQHKLDDARTSAIISTIGFGVGIAAIGAACFLVLGAQATPTQTGLRLAPVVDPGGGGLSLAGRF